MRNLRQYKNEKGLTLVELLATLAIISIVAALIIGIIISSINNSKSVEKSNNLRNQVNQIMLQLTSIHQESTEYDIKYGDTHTFLINHIDSDGTSKTTTIDLGSYEYELTVNGTTLLPEQNIYMDLADSDNLKAAVSLKLKGIDGEGRDDDVSVQSTISRMTPAQGGGEPS